MTSSPLCFTEDSWDRHRQTLNGQKWVQIIAGGIKELLFAHSFLFLKDTVNSYRHHVQCTLLWRGNTRDLVRCASKDFLYFLSYHLFIPSQAACYFPGGQLIFPLLVFMQIAAKCNDVQMLFSDSRPYLTNEEWKRLMSQQELCNHTLSFCASG